MYAMFKKILIADDIDTINLGILSQLEKNGSVEVDHVRYCDDAYLKIKKAILDKEPFDLLISDLSFKQDHREVVFKSGEDLILAVKKEQPEISIIAYSVDERSFRIKSLFKDLDINAFVSKGREGNLQLLKAMRLIYNSDKKYISPHLEHFLNNNSVIEIDKDDIELLKHLSLGLNQEEIAKALKELGKSSASLSSIEKRIGKLKIFFQSKKYYSHGGNCKRHGVDLKEYYRCCNFYISCTKLFCSYI